MAAKRTPAETSSPPRQPPARTLEARENQLISLAVDLAEQQLRDGTASSQTLSLFLKESTTRAQLEKERLRHENILLEKKAEALASQARQEELFAEALAAMREYKGESNESA